MLCWLPITATAEADWPAIRGIGNNAYVEDLQLHLPWPEDGPPVLWEKRIGQGYSSFAVVGGRIFTQAQDYIGQFVLCLDLESGSTIWKTRYAPPWDADRDWPGPYATPSWSDGRVYFAGCFGTIGCLDAETGKTIWKIDVATMFEGKGYGFGYACSPLVEDGRVFLPVGGEKASVIALNAVDGEVLWATGSDPAGYTPSYPVTIDGRRQIISSLQNVLVAHDPTTGQELWRYRLKRGYNPHPSWPLFEEPYLFVSLAFRRGARCLQLSYLDGIPRIDELWKSDSLSNDLFSGVVHQGHVYGFDIHDPQTDSGGGTKGEFKCIDLVSGKEQWSTAAVGGSSVVTDGEHLILFDERGNLVVALTSPEAFHEVARTRIALDDVSWTVPSLYGQRMLVRGTDKIACVFLGDPREMPKHFQEAPTEITHTFMTLWLRKNHSDAFWSPSLSDYLKWFGTCLFVLFFLAPAATIPVRHARGKQAGIVYSLVVATISFIALPLLTEVSGRLVFTWPAGLFAMFVLLLMGGVAATRANDLWSAVLARFMTALFCLVCCGYFVMCHRLSLLTGWGFLIGFLPAWPTSMILARRLLDPGRSLTVWGYSVFSFAVYFWASVLAFELKAFLYLR